MWIQVISFIIGIIILVVTIIIAFRLRKGGKNIKISPNLPLVINFARTKFTDGYFAGILSSQKPRKNGCTLIEFYPFDLEQGEDIPLPTIQSVVVKNDFVKRLPRGNPSSRREIVILLGRSSKDLPEIMRGAEEGKWMTMESQKAWVENIAGTMIKSGDDAIAELMKDYARGQITKNAMQEHKERLQKLQEIITQKMMEEKDEKK